MSEWITFTLEYPHHNLSPNARCHWRTKAGHVQVARLVARNDVNEQIEERRIVIPSSSPRGFVVEYDFYVCNGARMADVDNLIASMKASLDGVFDALHLNDKTVKKISGETFVSPKPISYVDIRIKPKDL